MSKTNKYVLGGIVLYIALLISLSLTATNISTAIVRASSILIPQILIFYLNYLFFAPKYLESGKVLKYFLLISFILFASSYLGGKLDLYLIEKFPIEQSPKPHRGSTFIYFARFFMSLMPVIVSTLILKSHLLIEKNKESLELQNKMLEAETNALKAQINPHFLFNTLNNIYSLSQLNSNKTGEAILQLSDILRYVTYEGNQNLVLLKEEIHHIENYIALQYLKDEDKSNISINIAKPTKSLKISPLLLIPFIENCFKHGNHHDKVNGWIKIDLTIDGNKLNLLASNSTSTTQSHKDTVGGVGMENVKRRLSILYPNKHKLNIRLDKSRYITELEIILET